MATRHTPGPWRIDETKTLGAYGIWTAYPTHPGHDGAGYESQILSFWSGGNLLMEKERRNANARLIAAAPDLLAICKRMDSFLEDIDAKVYRAFQTLHADILCAIAKAEGA